MRFATYISLLWAGLLLGSSFLATPAKFLAPSLSMQDALEVGQATFNVLNLVEYALLTALAVSLMEIITKPILIFTFITFLLLLIIQQLFILPALEVRTDLIIQGQEVAHSNLHLYYVAVEFLKVCVLVCLATVVNKAEKTPLEELDHSYLTDTTN